MKTTTLVANFSLLAFLAVASTIILFNTTTTPTADVIKTQYPTLSSERLLAREPCKYVDAVLGLNKEDCQMIGSIDCHKKYGITRNHHGDAYTYSFNCLRQCIRDIRAQCDHTASAFFREGKR